MSSSSTSEGPGSVSGAPNLPAGFTDTLTSRYVDTGEVRLHAVTGGGGRTSLSSRSTSAVSGYPANPRTGTTPPPSPTTWWR